MHYIILDLEWNQPFTVKMTIKEPVALCGEIIQIGAVKLDENYHLIDTFKIMVAPKYYRKMHKKVSELTRITTDDLRYGFPFKTAFKHFSQWCGDDFSFLTWGPDDIRILRENMCIHKMKTEWIPNVYNLQIIFDNQLTKTNHQISLKNALEYVGEPALEAHDALNDARNTASLCPHIDMNKGFDQYHELEKSFGAQKSPALNKRRNGKSYRTKEEAFNDSSLLTFYCPDCGAQVVCADFVKQNSDKYICVGKCEDGKKFFVRFKFIRETNGTFSVARIIYDMDEEHSNYYHAKKQLRELKEQLYMERVGKAV